MEGVGKMRRYRESQVVRLPGLPCHCQPWPGDRILLPSKVLRCLLKSDLPLHNDDSIFVIFDSFSLSSTPYLLILDIELS